MSDVTAGLIGLAGVLLLFLTGIELGFAMALVGFLGFSFTKGKMLKIKLSLKASRAVKHRIKGLSGRSRGISLEQMIQQLKSPLQISLSLQGM